MTIDTADQMLPAVSRIFSLLGDPSRLKILFHCFESPKAVSEIASAISLSPSLVSHHLRLMRRARLIRGDRQSKQVYYRVSNPRVAELLHSTLLHVREEHLH
ncbi:winged helix-turn-helix transcriptional regulator [Tabrizicola sp. SY72]|jgi:DNA-binding transcriptional ArsR family regulator|nr:winged helix-turn-helix transcriptional regulator [Paracoccus sp. IB05]NTT88465.1 winged helix-turn-helix transcriptional regulator [Tabrizicola sp. SY72]